MKSLSHAGLLVSVVAITVGTGQSKAAFLQLNSITPTSSLTAGDYVYTDFSFTGFTANANDTFLPNRVTRVFPSLV
jgi:hypothetical protein